MIRTAIVQLQINFSCTGLPWEERKSNSVFFLYPILSTHCCKRWLWGGVVQAGENKNTLIYRANGIVITDGQSEDADQSIEEVIKKCTFFNLIDE